MSQYQWNLFIASIVAIDAHEEAQIEEPTDDRANRHILPEKAEHEGDSCRKVDMIIHTANLSADFIAPKLFNAFQCIGRCSLTQRKNFINHSLIKAIVNKKKGIKTEGEACCVPKKMRPMSTLFVDKNNQIVLKRFENMIVEECGCY